MSKIANDGLTRSGSGTRYFTVVPMWQTVVVKGLTCYNSFTKLQKS